MATLTYSQATINGVAPTLAAATSGAGDVIPINDRGVLVVKNGSGSAITVTTAVPGNTKYGIANPDPTASVAAGATAYSGPFPADLADSTDGMVHITYSSVTTVTVGGLQI